jgi:glycosyltransferase involved in cell wall biosynthesis
MDDDMSAWPAAPPPVVDTSRLPFAPDPRRVKVLHVITRFEGGSGGNTLLSAIGMDERRYEVWVAGGPGGPLWERAREAGVTTLEIPSIAERIDLVRDVRALWALTRLMRRERFSLVHTHCSKAGVLGRLAARLSGTPIVVHTFHAFAYHDFMSARRRRAYVLMERLAGHLADRFIAVSPRVAREAVEMRLARPGSVLVVPSSVEHDDIPDEPAPALRRDLGLRDDVPVVGTVGRLVFQKAPLDFVRMAAHVARERPDVRFVMVGDASDESAPMDQATRREARRLGVDVLFTGYRSDAPRVAALFDVFVISSLYEGLGRSLTEAMASGRSVVATAVNGVPDLIEPGSTGLLAPPGRPDLIAACVLWLLDHPQEARRMGRQARARVRSLLDPGAMCRMLDREYSDLLGLPLSSDRTSPRPTDVVELHVERPARVTSIQRDGSF